MKKEEVLNLAQAELRAMYKRVGIKGSNVLDLIDKELAKHNLVSTCCHAELIHFDNYGYNECSECGKTYRQTK